MRIKKTILLAAVGAIVLLGGALIVAFIVPAIAHKPGPADQYKYPLVWEIARGTEPESGALPRIELNKDGSAEVTNLRLGAIDTTSTDRPCVVPSSGGYTGEVSWEIDENGAIRVHSEAGSAVVTPSAARFSGADWTGIRELFCDETYADFSVRSEAW